MGIRAVSTSNYYSEESFPLVEPDTEALLEETLLEEPTDAAEEFNDSPEDADEGISLKYFTR